MTRISIELTEDLRRKAEARAAASGHASVERYIESLVEADTVADVDDENYGAPEHLTISSQDDLQTKLLEGVESGPVVEMTEHEWASIRQEVAERIGDRRPPATDGAEKTAHRRNTP
jgi:hypothetical protein